MPDLPIDNTDNLGLGQWAEGANPGFAALNENWELIDDAIGALDTLISTKASQSSLDALALNFAALEDEVTTAFLAFVRHDGSVSMSGNLNLSDNKIVDLANGTNPQDAVNRGQLDAAVSAAVGGLVGVYHYVLARNTGDLTDTSPVLFEADENDSTTTNEDMHDEVTDNSEFVAPQDGFYMMIFRGRITDGGGASCKWLINGIEAPACVFPLILHDVGENETFLQDVCPMALQEGDVVTLGVYGLVSEPLTIKEDSTVAMFLLMANGAGTGDLKADGTIPMTDDLDLGGFNIINLADGVDATDAVTVGQLEFAVDALQDQIDAFTAGNTLIMDEVECLGGDFAFNSAWSEFTASRLEFTLAGTRYVAVDAQATAGVNFLQQTDAQMGIRVQKLTGPGGSADGDPIDYYGTFGGCHFGWTIRNGISAAAKPQLTVGTWRVSIICRTLPISGNSCFIYASGSTPARIGVMYQD